MSTKFYVRGLDVNGNEVWYTGRTGERWVSENKSEAFPFMLGLARAKATQFNQYTSLHGIRFVVPVGE